MDREVKSLQAYRGHVRRAMNHLAQSIQQGAEPDYIRKQTLVLGEKWKKYESKFDDITVKYYEEENFDKVEHAHVNFEDEYHDAQLKASTELHQLTPKPAPAPTPGSNSQAFKVKLPDIRLSEFHGNHVEWDRFWNQFSSLVDSKSDIDEVTKYTYLTQCLKGPAKEVIAGFRGEASDY